jgi:hypothetical protein
MRDSFDHDRKHPFTGNIKPHFIVQEISWKEYQFQGNIKTRQKREWKIMPWKTGLILILLCSITAACGQNEVYVYSNDQSAQSQSYKPTLDVGLATSGSTATVTVKTNLTLSKEHIDGARKEGEGHIHAYVDDGDKLMTADTTIQFPNLKPGKHVVKVSLHNNDHTPYDVSKSMTFEIK